MAIVASQFTSATPSGTPKITGQKIALTAGAEQTLISEVVPSGKAWSIYEVKIETRAYSSFEIFIDSVLVGSGKLSAATENVAYSFSPAYPLSSGQSFLIKLTSIPSTPAVDVGCWLHYTEADA